MVGRGLRRQSYELNPKTGLFDVEYADIMGIPFDFASSPQVAKPTAPKPVTRVYAIAYNLTRIMNIMGVQPLLAAMRA